MTSLVMSNAYVTTEIRGAQKAPPLKRPSVLKMLFGDLLSAGLTTGALLVILSLLPALKWGVLDATWATVDPEACRAGGACWAFIGAKLRFILFGLYPPEEQWRPTIVMGLILAMVLASLSPSSCWRSCGAVLRGLTSSRHRNGAACR
jgi:general L-amino acid transport system permease protein